MSGWTKTQNSIQGTEFITARRGAIPALYPLPELKAYFTSVEASTTSNANFGLTPGVDPTTLTNGDLWTTSELLKVRLGSQTMGLTRLYKTLTADAAYTSGTAAQNWFPSAGGVTLQAATSYLFDGQLLQTNGTVSHTVGLSFAGTATLTSIAYIADASAGAVNTTTTTSNRTMVTQATNTVVTAAITTAGTQIRVRGVVRINAGGTFIPQFTFSASPGAGNNLANTNFMLLPIGDNTTVSIGTWA